MFYDHLVWFGLLWVCVLVVRRVWRAAHRPVPTSVSSPKRKTPRPLKPRPPRLPRVQTPTHLGHAAESLYGEDSSPVKQRWLKEHQQILFEGQVLRLAETLQALAAGQTGGVRDNLLEQVTYFENNQHRMNYPELREEGWLIGSGMVESGAKQFKDRFTDPGMRWSRPGAERLLPIRAAVMSQTFDPAWRAIYKSPNN